MKKSGTEKAWETMRAKSPGEKAAQTKRRKRGARKAIAKVLEKNWDPKKVEFLKELNRNATAGRCIVCGDERRFVLQQHHADREKTIEVTVCANCHDTIRRGSAEDLKEAHERGKP